MNLLVRLICVIGTVTVFIAANTAAMSWLPDYLAGMVGTVTLIAVWILAGKMEKEIRR